MCTEILLTLYWPMQQVQIHYQESIDFNTFVYLGWFKTGLLYLMLILEVITAIIRSYKNRKRIKEEEKRFMALQ